MSANHSYSQKITKLAKLAFKQGIRGWFLYFVHTD
jgi:hypothetical protein